MPRKNALRDEDQSQEAIRGEMLTNMRVRRVLRMLMPDGSVREFVSDDTSSSLMEDGTYLDNKVSNIICDRAGNILPEDGRPVAISHTGLFILKQELVGYCTCWFHLPWRSRIFFKNLDGTDFGNGKGRCSCCQETAITVCLGLGIAGGAIVIGLYKGAWGF